MGPRRFLFRRRLRRRLSAGRRTRMAARLERLAGFGGTFDAPLIDRQRVAAALAAATPPAPPRSLAQHAAPPAVSILVSSRGNAFMRDIADDLGALLAACGTAVARCDEHAAIPPSLPIVVAPHEFFTLGRGPRWITESFLGRAVMLNTEQPHTDWFAAALPYLLGARGVLDLNGQTAGWLAAGGVPALALTLPPPRDPTPLQPADRRHRLFRALPPAAREAPDPTLPWAARPIDLTFFGTATPRRAVFFAENAAFLAAQCCVVHCVAADRPIQDGAAGRLARHVGGHARLTLNLHRDDTAYFEAHRLLRLGVGMGSVVVSEPCLPHPAIRAGEHYFAATLPALPELIGWLLHAADGQAAAEAARTAATRLLDGALHPAAAGAPLITFLHEATA